MERRNNYSLLSQSRIVLGGYRQRMLTRLRAWRDAPNIQRAAAPTLAMLREMRERLPADTPLIGILLAEHLGDLVACEPVIPFLKNQNPGARMVWLTKPIYASLLESHPLLDAVLPLHSVSEAEVVTKRGCLDQVVDLHLPGKRCSRFKRDYTKRSGDRTVDAQNYFDFGPLLTGLSRSAGLPGLKSAPRLYVGTITRKKVDALGLPEHYIVIHALSNQPRNNWDHSHWPILVGRLQKEYKGAVVEVGLESVFPPGLPGTINLCGRLSPIESAEVIARAHMFMGVDSGPAHCANAFEVPSVILLGQYLSFVRYMPYTGYFRDNEQNMLLRSATRTADLPIEAVLSRFQHVRQTNTRSLNPCWAARNN